MENVLDRINKIDKIVDDENLDNPVNPVKCFAKGVMD